jgi:hypothetical protein
MAKVGTAIRRGALFAAVEHIGKKLGCRDILPDGTSMPVAFTIDAMVRRSHLVESFNGHLNVGHSFSKSSSSACDQEHLLACFADIVSPPKREQHFNLIREYFRRKKCLPPISPDVLATCSSLLEERERPFNHILTKEAANEISSAS